MSSSDCVVVHNEAAFEELFPICKDQEHRRKVSTVQKPIEEQSRPVIQADRPKRKIIFSMDMCDDTNSKLCTDISTENHKYLTESEEHIMSHESLKDYKRNNIYITWNERVFIPLHARIQNVTQGDQCSSKQNNSSQDNEDADTNLWLTMQLQYINSDARSRSRLRMKTSKNETSNLSRSDMEIPHILRIEQRNTSLVLDN